MDHSEATRLQAAEKYVLGELSPAQREDYEEHCFDCADCALDLKAMTGFADNAREVLRAEGRKSAEKDPVPAGSRWFSWFRPIIAVPAFAALLLVVTYQNIITIPRVKEEVGHGTAQVFTSSFSLQMANTRGGEEVKVQVHPAESFALDFDFTPSRTFESYVCRLQDESGRSLLQVNVPGSSANKEAHLIVPAGLVRPGKYSLVFLGAPDSQSQPPRDEVLRLSFAIEFLP